MARHRSRRMKSQSTDNIPPIVQLWMLRILVLLGGHRELMRDDVVIKDSLAEAVGLVETIDPELGEFTTKEALVKLKHMHRIAERTATTQLPPLNLHENIIRLAELVGLSDTDCRILAFAVLIKNEPMLDECADCLCGMTTEKLYRTLSVIIELPDKEVRASLSLQGVLAQSGLVTIDRSGSFCLSYKIDLLSSQFADQMVSVKAEPAQLLRGVVTPCTPAHLSYDDYEHIEASLAVLRRYLIQAQKIGQKGINIFIHGTPGTGKSQLAKVLAQEMGCALFEVASEDSDGDPVDGEKRLRAFRAAQYFFTEQKSLIVFDEVEDVFNDGNNLFGRKSTAQTRKAWINRMLEENPVPTIWLSNSVHCLDNAFIRRFDLVIELPIPPKKQRESILNALCSEFLDEPSIKRIAESESLAPAVVSKATSVIRTIHDQLDASAAGSALELLINNTLEAQGHKPITKNDPNRLPDLYNPEYVHADCDLSQIARGLAQSKSGRLCLYGPPGTGKTAYGRYLAEQLGVPLLVKRASDLTSMWVGESEKNIARAFKQAEDQGALLLIDEVDSFLQDRRNAQKSWEVTLVNEMLTQMEAFSGVFVASTNLMEGLDQAALRRFDLKVKFGFLKAEQTLQLFEGYCRQLNLPEPHAQQILQLKKLQQMTPGDFAAVIRQSRFRPIQTCDALIAALLQESLMKEGSKAVIGFVH